MRLLRSALISVAFAAAVAAHATVTFSNITFSGSNTLPSGTLTSGASVTTLGNALTFSTPNARVGIGAATGITDGLVLLQYDAKVNGGGAVGSVAWSVDTLIQGFLLGSGTLSFTEDVIELDSLGNEINPSTPIGHLSTTWTSSTPGGIWGGTINLSKQVAQIRVKKSFYLDASIDSPAPLDRSVLGQVNQSINVVPEPGTWAALGLGAAALLRRRRK